MMSNIYIVGHIGAGKSVFGLKLAKLIKWHFIDADLKLEFNFRKHINNIIGEKGQQYLLKNLEASIDYFSSHDKTVIVLDNLIVKSKKALGVLNLNHTIYIQTTAEEQLRRLSRSGYYLLPCESETKFLNEQHILYDELFDKVDCLKLEKDLNLSEALNLTISYLKNNTVITGDTRKIISNRKIEYLFHNENNIPIKLTKRQSEILYYLSDGLSSKKISSLLNVTTKTVEAHLLEIMRITGCKTSKEIISLYYTLV